MVPRLNRLARTVSPIRAGEAASRNAPGTRPVGVPVRTGQVGISEVGATANGSSRWTGRLRASYGVRVPRSVRWFATPLAVVVLLLAACSTAEPVAQPLPAGGAEPSPAVSGVATPAPSGPSGAPTASAGAVDHTDVLAVYAAWWRALQTAYAAGDPDEAALEEYAVDPILTRQRTSIRALRAQGVVQRTTFTLAPRLRYRTDDYAEVEDCVRGPANTYYDVVTGRPRSPRGYRNDVPTEDRLLMTLQRRGDAWFVVAATSKGDVQC